jgi:hypothetical protein
LTLARSAVPLRHIGRHQHHFTSNLNRDFMSKGIEPKDKDLVARKIMRLFDRVGCPAQLILKTPKSGDEVENGYGVDFNLPPYAVIHKGRLHEKNADSRVFKWQRLQEVEMMKFDIAGVTSLKGLVEQLGRDGFEIVWQREGIEI